MNLYDDNIDGDGVVDDGLPDPNAPTSRKEGTLSRLSARLRLTWPSKRVVHGTANGDVEGNNHATPDDAHMHQDTHADGMAITVNSTAKSSGGKHENKDTSHHTFYIQNSQRRLKLVAKNEVTSPSLMHSGNSSSFSDNFTNGLPQWNERLRNRTGRDQIVSKASPLSV